jgi:hypothetical protein
MRQVGHPPLPPATVPRPLAGGAHGRVQQHRPRLHAVPPLLLHVVRLRQPRALPPPRRRRGRPEQQRWPPGRRRGRVRVPGRQPEAGKHVEHCYQESRDANGIPVSGRRRSDDTPEEDGRGTTTSIARRTLIRTSSWHHSIQSEVYAIHIKQNQDPKRSCPYNGKHRAYAILRAGRLPYPMNHS